MVESTRSVTAHPVVRGPYVVGPDALLALHARAPHRYPFLLESAASAGTLGRYDVLFACPGDHLVLDTPNRIRAPASLPVGPDGFLGHLDAWWRRESVGPQPPSGPAGELPFTGGWFLFLGYELASEIEPTLDLPQARRSVAAAIRVPVAVVRERATSRAWVVSESSSADVSLAIARELVDAPTLMTRPATRLLASELVEEDPERFLAAVEQALRHVRAGDIYQANLSRGWQGALAPDATPIELYARLRRANPAPFAALAVLGDRALISSSPERLVAVRNGTVVTRPIAGTRPRGATAELDSALVRELRAHPKERSEHVMLLDLERNDLGRICRAGTVRVDEYMAIETYAHVHHIVSNVRGELRTGTTPGDVIRAVFPGGTITGCPKVRCMDIIGALEGTARDAYTGSVGYLNLDGSMDLNILIRTMELSGRDLEFRAGAGIVAESQPYRELEETRAKALGLVRALAPAGRAR